ncbi:3-hydroxybutyryl-CoA dehydrogenase [Catenulispora yoronensis]
MGAGIAELCALNGLDVRLAVSRPASLESAPRRLAASLDRRVAKGRLTPEGRDAALAAVSVGTDLGDLADRELVVEAVVEDEAVKLAVFSTLDKVVEPDAILASTTSALSITRLAGVVQHPGRVLGVHFFNPVAVLDLVELIPTLLTDESVCRRAEEFVTALGKKPVTVGDRSGFVVNALLIPYLLAAIRMVESGYSSAESVDQAMESGCAHPMGPLKLADFIGLDVVAAIAEALHAESRQPLHAPPPLLSRMVEAGILGRKSGRGFHSYA